MLEGSCCCGTVRFVVHAPPKLLAVCHCSRCRKLGATPFAIVARESFELRAGREQVVAYRPEPPFKYVRCFCGACGTSLGEILSEEDAFPVSASCFDTDLGMAVRFHEHVAAKPSWSEIPAGAKQFEGDPG